ncbi:hypothetical protein PG996_004861 [Apiospora saccharicola]|uniref:Uncharacterized protein n=1 Tax=Apiospora saccharicola TaxID=335842 RepID=A0ABR1VJV8_9PEZI
MQPPRVRLTEPRVQTIYAPFLPSVEATNVAWLLGATPDVADDYGNTAIRLQPATGTPPSNRCFFRRQVGTNLGVAGAAAATVWPCGLVPAPLDPGPIYDRHPSQDIGLASACSNPIIEVGYNHAHTKLRGSAHGWARGDTEGLGMLQDQNLLETIRATFVQAWNNTDLNPPTDEPETRGLAFFEIVFKHKTNGDCSGMGKLLFLETQTEEIRIANAIITLAAMAI